MAYDDERLRAIFEKTDGRCHLCWRKLAFKNYGCDGSRGAWQVDHGNPRAKGGGNGLNNLQPACCDCNREKSCGSTRWARRRVGHGKTCAPMSKVKRAEARVGNAVVGGGVGALIGALVAGPAGARLAGAAGAALGALLDPEQ